MRTAISLICITLWFGCGGDSPDAPDGGVNDTPTGSITVQSLCDRVVEDVQVTNQGIDTFALLWVDDHYLLAYAERTQGDLYVAQIGADGVALGAPTLVDSGPGVARLPSLVRTGSGFLVAWQDEDMSVSVRARALDSTGQPSGDVRSVAMGRGGQMRPVLSPSPAGVAVAWMDQAAADASKINELGDSSTWVAVLDDQAQERTDLPAARVNPSTLNGFPWLAGDESRLAMLWSDSSADRTDTYFSTLDAALAMRAPTNVRGADTPTVALLGRLARTESGYLAAWEDQRNGMGQIFMAILDDDGGRHTGGLVEEPDTGDANWPHIAWTGTSAGIVYYQFRNGRPQVFMTFVDQDGNRVGGAADAQVSKTTAWARFPDVAWNGSEFGVVWLDSRTGQPELFFNRVACKKPASL